MYHQFQNQELNNLTISNQEFSVNTSVLYYVNNASIKDSLINRLSVLKARCQRFIYQHIVNEEFVVASSHVNLHFIDKRFVV